MFSSVKIGKIYQVKNIVQNNPCLECTACTRLRLMEVGFFPGARFKIVKHLYGIWVMQFLTDKGFSEQTLALRDEETVQIILEDV
jgi:Fe2+ transport system protein FeoA